MIEIRNGRYETEGFTLDVGLNVAPGEFCAVLGPSGAGKSTLLSIIAGFEDLRRGEIYLNGITAHKQPSSRPVSMVFQDHNVFAHLDVWANVALGISPSLKLNAKQDTDIENALTRVGLQTLAKRKPGEISGGERQRVALARVLVRNKPILLLDEPFAALDPGLRRDMLDLVSDLQKERNLTVLMVTHQPEDTKHAAKKVIFVSDGVVRDSIPTKDFFISHDHQIEKYLGKRR
jgi:thiamine transport system ATP-binding protein